MANYIDGFILPVPRKHLDEYKAVAVQVAEVWKEHGAMEYHEYVLDDIQMEGTRSFTEISDAKGDEAVIFGWVVFDSRETRDRANELVISDPRMSDLVDPLMDPDRLIFNASRMVYGGFKALVNA